MRRKLTGSGNDLRRRCLLKLMVSRSSMMWRVDVNGCTHVSVMTLASISVLLLAFM